MEHSVGCVHFADFDEYREHLRHWDTDGFQIFPGSLAIKRQYLDFGDLVMDRTRFAPASVLRSARRPDWFTFVVDLSAKRWCGIDVPTGSVRLIVPRRETTAVSHEPWDTICISIHQDALKTWPLSLAAFADRGCPPERSILASDRVALAAFQAWAEALFATNFDSIAEGDTDLWFATIRHHIKQHLLAMLKCGTPKAVSSAQRVARYDLALAAMRRIHADAERRCSVLELRMELGVSDRALEYAFKATFGLSPSQYMLAARLNRARHELRVGRLTGRSVTTIAFDHQFENLSRFAHQYTRLFGERPSDTLRAARVAFQQA